MNAEPVTPTAPVKTNHSYLLVHLDEDLTQAVFVREVAGRMGIVGADVVPSTYQPPEANILIGVTEAVQRVENQTGHHLMTTEGDLVRNIRSPHAGVEEVLLTASTVTPWSILVIAPTEKDPALASVDRLLTAFANYPPVIWTGENKKSLEDQVNAFLALQPTIVLFVGDKDRKNVLNHFAEAIKWGGRLLPHSVIPPVVFAANAEGLSGVEVALAGEVVLHVTDDIRPQARRERLNPVRQLLAELVRESHLSRIPSMPDLIRWSLTQPHLDMLMATRSLDFLVRKNQLAALSVWVSRDSIWLIYAHPEGLNSHIFSKAGLGMVFPDRENVFDVKSALDWVPETDSQEHHERLLEQLAHQAIWEDTVPEKPLHYTLWMVGIRKLLQEALREAMEGWGMNADKPLPVDELIVGGSILRMVFPTEQLLQVIIDGLQPAGVFRILADRFALLPSLGLLAEHNPKAASDVLNSRPLEELAVCICPIYSSRKAITLSWTAVDGEHQRTFNGDDLQLVELTQITADQVAIKTGRRGALPGIRGRTTQIDVDQDRYIRLMIDTRGRPVKLPADNKKRQLALLRWQAGMGN